MAIREKNDGFLVHLRNWGLKVEEHEGWRERGRPYNFYPRGVVCHHTASAAGSGNFSSEEVVVNGRSDLPGPLCHVLLGRDGTVKTIAMGDANHAGEGGPLKGIPANEANYFMWGIEAENNGAGEPWPEVQMDAYAKLCAALLDWVNVNDVSMVIGHKEWTSRKTDPDFDMNAFRARVAKAMKAGPDTAEISLSNLKYKAKNRDVLRVKQALKKKGFSKGFLMNDIFGLGMRHQYSRFQKSLGYKGKQANGIPGRVSLEKLGFVVED
jgi:N-acetyl-anhydromuramyl-L-alanine amidase AmpD